LNIYKRGDVGRKRPYITHPDRLKLAEEEYVPIPFEYKKKFILKKSVRFEEKVVIHTVKTFLVKTVRIEDKVVVINTAKNCEIWNY
jgi:hypothetical protein